MSIDEYIKASEKIYTRLDVLHLSPPCQFFSPAHTIESAQDDEHIFALFGGQALIDKLRPRIITLEQTFGITQDRHLEYFRTLISDFTQLGYSVRWKIVKLCTWGLAQDRKRLIVIAAAPGEKLPPFPEATHSEFGNRGTRKFTTMNAAINKARPGDELHDLGNVRHFRPSKPAMNGNRLAMTITTSGAEHYHPSGKRELSLRELACIQGFPIKHRFIGNKTAIRRQIGNAWAPNTVTVLYKHLEEWLLKQDGMRRSQPPAVLLDVDVMVLDDGPDEPAGHVGPAPDMGDVVMEDQSLVGNNQDAMVIDLT